MKNHILRGALATLAAYGLMTATASAALISDNLDSYWKIGSFALTGSIDQLDEGQDFYTEIAGAIFGIYEFGDTSTFYGLLFEDSTTSITDFYFDASNVLWVTNSDGDTYTTSLTFESGYFGFYYSANGITVYSDSSLNYFPTAGADAMKFYDDTIDSWSGDSGMIDGLAGDIHGVINANGDSTNELAVGLTNIIPAPEPGTMLLFGAGLTGLTGLARRKRK